MDGSGNDFWKRFDFLLKRKCRRARDRGTSGRWCWVNDNIGLGRIWEFLEFWTEIVRKWRCREPSPTSTRTGRISCQVVSTKSFIRWRRVIRRGTASVLHVSSFSKITHFLRIFLRINISSINNHNDSKQQLNQYFPAGVLFYVKWASLITYPHARGVVSLSICFGTCAVPVRLSAVVFISVRTGCRCTNALITRS